MESNTHVKCFGCKKTPRSKIYLCLTDCSICDKCYEKSEQIINRSNGVLIRNICPHCSCPFALWPKRNLKEEKNIESLGLSFPCNYQKDGCVEEAKLGQIQQHEEKNCPFRPISCLVKNCKDTFGISKTLAHFKEKHGLSNCTGASSFPWIRSILVPLDKESFHSLQLGFDESRFIAHGFLRENVFHMIIWLIGEKEEAQKFSYTLSTANPNAKPYLAYNGNPVPICDRVDDVVKTHRSFRHCKDFLSFYCEPNLTDPIAKFNVTLEK